MKRNIQHYMQFLSLLIALRVIQGDTHTYTHTHKTQWQKTIPRVYAICSSVSTFSFRYLIKYTCSHPRQHARGQANNVPTKICSVLTIDLGQKCPGWYSILHVIRIQVSGMVHTCDLFVVNLKLIYIQDIYSRFHLQLSTVAVSERMRYTGKVM